jgi:hypothetical protein
MIFMQSVFYTKTETHLASFGIPFSRINSGGLTSIMIDKYVTAWYHLRLERCGSVN